VGSRSFDKTDVEIEVSGVTSGGSLSVADELLELRLRGTADAKAPEGLAIHACSIDEPITGSIVAVEVCDGIAR
jgi:hypothetical protein